MKRNLGAILAAASAAALLASGCGARHEAETAPIPEPTAPAVIAQSAPVSVAQQMAGKTGIITVRMTDRGFLPDTLRVHEGDTVRIYLKNDDSREHNFVVSRHGIVTSNLAAGAENYVEFTAGQKGDWPFVSDAPGSPEPGFQGRLSVE